GNVTTVSSSAKSVAKFEPESTDQVSDQIMFNAPRSVSIDGTGNIYVVDDSGVLVITSAGVFSLAQSGSFGKAASVVVQGQQAFVLDANSTTDADAVKVVTVGAPVITNLSRNSDRLEGGAEVVVTGKNFAPESLVVLGDKIVSDAVVES